MTEISDGLLFFWRSCYGHIVDVILRLHQRPSQPRQTCLGWRCAGMAICCVDSGLTLLKITVTLLAAERSGFCGFTTTARENNSGSFSVVTSMAAPEN